MNLEEQVWIKVSAAYARQKFNGCDPEFIANVCHAACCDAPTRPTGMLVTIHPSEQATIEACGGVVENGLLQPRPGERKCPFKTADHLCSLHFTPNKPFGCIASPFTLNKHNTLIIRNRYRLLRCYNAGRKLPAYRAFKLSLRLIFGAEWANEITAHLDAGGGDLMAPVSRRVYNMLTENDDIKKAATGPTDRIGGMR